MERLRTWSFHSTHMVDHDRHRQRGDLGGDRGEQFAVGRYLQMPIELSWPMTAEGRRAELGAP